MKALLVVLALLAASCGTPVATVGDYGLAEFSIDGPGSLADSVDVVNVENHGEFPHTLVVTRTDGTVVAATDLIQPGESVALDLGLEAGRYLFTCRIVSETPDGEIVDHFESGMRRVVNIQD